MYNKGIFLVTHLAEGESINDALGPLVAAGPAKKGSIPLLSPFLTLSFRGKIKALSNKTFYNSHASLARFQTAQAERERVFWLRGNKDPENVFQS